MFCTIWVHSGPFGCLTKLCGKRGELVQKFVPLDPKLTLWFISYHLGAFGTVCLRYKMAELVQKFVPRSRVGIFRNERTRFTPLDPKLMFWCIWDRLVALRNSVQNGPN